MASTAIPYTKDTTFAWTELAKYLATTTSKNGVIIEIDTATFESYLDKYDELLIYGQFYTTDFSLSNSYSATALHSKTTIVSITIPCPSLLKTLAIGTVYWFESVGFYYDDDGIWRSGGYSNLGIMRNNNNYQLYMGTGIVKQGNDSNCGIYLYGR